MKLSKETILENPKKVLDTYFEYDYAAYLQYLEQNDIKLSKDCKEYSGCTFTQLPYKKPKKLKGTQIQNIQKLGEGRFPVLAKIGNGKITATNRISLISTKTDLEDCDITTLHTFPNWEHIVPNDEYPKIESVPIDVLLGKVQRFADICKNSLCNVQLCKINGNYFNAEYLYNLLKIIASFGFEEVSIGTFNRNLVIETDDLFAILHRHVIPNNAVINPTEPVGYSDELIALIYEIDF